MTDLDPFNAALAAALAPPDRPADVGFVNVVELAAREASRFGMERKRTWHAFAADMVAAFALLAACLVLSFIWSASSDNGPRLRAYSGATTLVMTLWMSVQRWNFLRH